MISSVSPLKLVELIVAIRILPNYRKPGQKRQRHRLARTSFAFIPRDGFAPGEASLRLSMTLTEECCPNLNCETRLRRFSVSDESRALAAVVSSTMAAFCCVP